VTPSISPHQKQRTSVLRTPERHANSRDGIQNSEASNRLLRTADIPQRHLPITHLGESRCRNAIMLAHPHSSTILRAAVAGNLMCRSFLPHIPDPKLLIAGCCHEHCAICAPGQALHDVAMLKSQGRIPRPDIPELDSIVAGGGSEDVLCGGVEQNLTDFA
jgi:hypothetical protein